jgi:hypothetical protein
MTATLMYFTVTDTMYEVVETDQTDLTGNQPTVMPISGTVTFTPCDAFGNALTEIDSAVLDSTIMLEPIMGRFNVNLTGGAPDGVLRTLNGTAGVELVDNLNLGLAVGGLTYRVDYTNVVFDSVGNRAIHSFWFVAPGNGAGVDLNTVGRLQLP